MFALRMVCIMPMASLRRSVSSCGALASARDKSSPASHPPLLHMRSVRPRRSSRSVCRPSVRRASAQASHLAARCPNASRGAARGPGRFRPARLIRVLKRVHAKPLRISRDCSHLLNVCEISLHRVRSDEIFFSRFGLDFAAVEFSTAHYFWIARMVRGWPA
jgi:hypothetical protein